MSYGHCGSYDYCKNNNVAHKDNSKEFVLIVVLFILLIIVGAHFMKDC